MFVSGSCAKVGYWYYESVLILILWISIVCKELPPPAAQKKGAGEFWFRSGSVFCLVFLDFRLLFHGQQPSFHRWGFATVKCHVREAHPCTRRWYSTAYSNIAYWNRRKQIPNAPAKLPEAKLHGTADGWGWGLRIGYILTKDKHWVREISAKVFFPSQRIIVSG